MEIALQKVTLGTLDVQLVIEESRHSVHLLGRSYDALEPLVQEVAQMRDPQNVEAIAEIANFLTQVKELHEVILDPDKFRRAYAMRLKEDEKVQAYGPFKVSEINAPHLHNNTLIFYVEDVGRSIPLKATFPFPPQGPFHYTPLPIIG